MKSLLDNVGKEWPIAVPIAPARKARLNIFKSVQQSSVATGSHDQDRKTMHVDKFSSILEIEMA